MPPTRTPTTPKHVRKHIAHKDGYLEPTTEKQLVLENLPVKAHPRGGKLVDWKKAAEEMGEKVLELEARSVMHRDMLAKAARETQALRTMVGEERSDHDDSRRRHIALMNDLTSHWSYYFLPRSVKAKLPR